MNVTDQGGFTTAFIRARFPRPLDHPLLASHQQTALTRAADMIRRWGGAVLADEVGMGKSFIAAALAMELRKEGLCPELIVPASLKDQWKETLRRFGLERATIISHESLHRGPIGRRPNRSVLIVVDEAHRFRNPQTKRYRALSETAIGQPVLLVTATPVCNRLSDLLSLLRIFAPDDVLRQEGIPSLTQLFAEADPGALQRLIEELVVRRTRESLPAALSFGGVERRVVPYRIERDGEIVGIVDELRFPLVAKPRERHLLRMLLWRRLESSQAALRESLRRQRRFYRRALEAEADGCRLSKREFLRIFGDQEDDVPFQELMFRSFWFTSGNSSDREMVDIERELEKIERLLVVLDGSQSQKLSSVVELCNGLSAEQILIFTSAIATAKVVYEALRDERRAAFVSSRNALVGHDVCPDNAYVFRMFAAGRLDLIVATDLASEGLNLQAASAVVHYDLPWNPVKLDQRNGRAARIGQKHHTVRAFYFVPFTRKDRRRSLRGLSIKSRIFRSLFGRVENGWLPPSIRAQIWLESAMLRARDDPSPSSPVRMSISQMLGAGARSLVHVREITGRDVVERIGVVERDELNFDWERVERAISEGNDAKLSNAVGTDSSSRNHLIRLQNRFVIPGRVVPGPRMALRRQLEALRSWSARWSELLSVSYCHGIERAIRDAAEGELVPEAADDLSRLLAENTKERPSFIRVQLVREG